MAINTHPITTVTASDIGRDISYQCSGMHTPRYGKITGLADLSGHMFVLFDGDRHNVLTDTYNARWGRTETSWIK